MHTTRFYRQKPDQQRILLTQASSGMELAEAVISTKEAILCGKGMILNDQLILRLMMLGIKRVTIKGKLAKERRIPSLHEQKIMLVERFSRCRSTGLMNAIRDAVHHNLGEPES